jgi:hypothetical protein
VLLGLAFGFAIGLSLGMLGGGGAVLAGPVLVYVLGEDVHTATATSLAIVAAGGLAASLVQSGEGLVCWPHTRAIAGPALAGVALGTVANQAIGDQALLLLFAPVMVAAALGTLHKARAETESGEDAARGCPPVRWMRDLGAGAGVGSLTGFFGVGGGFLAVPALRHLDKRRPDRDPGRVMRGRGACRGRPQPARSPGPARNRLRRAGRCCRRLPRRLGAGRRPARLILRASPRARRGGCRPCA